MLYLCHLLTNTGKEVQGSIKWVIKSHRMHMVGDLLLAWHDHYGLCTFSVQGLCTFSVQGLHLRDYNFESIAIPAVYNMLELKELLDE